MTKKRELPPDRLDECLRLNELFISKKKALGLSLQAIADAAEITPVAVAHYLKGANPLNMTFAAVMSQLLDVPVNSFSPRLAQEMARIAQVVNHFDDHYSQTPNPGLGKWAPTFTVLLDRLTLGCDPQGIELLKLNDDAMLPVLSNGDAVVVDARVRAVEGEGVYAAVYAGGTYIRRFQRVQNGGYLMLSDNANYPAIFVDPRCGEDLVILGRVIGALRGVRL